MRSRRATLLLLLTVGLAGLLAPPARAVRPKTWKIDEPGQFLAGTLDSVTVSSRAELMLAPRTQRYELDTREADTVNALIIGPDNIPYAGTGPNGVVYRLADDMPHKVTDVPEGQVFSLLFLPDGSLLVGTGGRRGVIYRVSPDGKRSAFWEPTNTRYVWSMVRDPAGTIYAATGSSGEIYRISPDGRAAKPIVSLGGTKNVLTLALTGNSHLVFGTDGNGLVGSADLASNRVRILFDAGDRSISALAAAPDGAIYLAATRADKPGGAGSPPGRPQGRPDLSESPDGPAPGSAVRPTATASAPGSATLPTARGDRGGNTIYRIDATGTVSEILALPAMFLSMVQVDGGLLVGTGTPGRVYAVQPQDERYTALLRDDPAFYSAAARAGAAAWVGTSRPASLVHILPDHASEGTFTSASQDASQVAQWGEVRADMTLPPGTRAAMQTRSGNLQDPAGTGWSDWSEPIALSPGAGTQIPSPPGRFLQVRLLLRAERAGASPVVRSLSIPYMTLNLAPEITSLSVQVQDLSSAKRPAEGKWYEPEATLPIEWQARDPNGDAMASQVDLRQVGTKRWIRIAKDITKNSYSWNSSTVPDGRYEVRVTVSDYPDNPPALALSKARISEPFIVDNTPPRIEDLRCAPAGRGTFRIQAALVDALSNVIAAQYTIDSADSWISLLPADGMFDSPSEALDFTVGPLAAGEHILALRVADSRGNTAHAWLTLTAE